MLSDSFRQDFLVSSESVAFPLVVSSLSGDVSRSNASVHRDVDSVSFDTPPPLIDPVNIDSHLANDVIKEPQTVDESVPLIDHVSIDSHLANDVVAQPQTVDESFPSASQACEFLGVSLLFLMPRLNGVIPFLYRLRVGVLIPPLKLFWGDCCKL